MFDSGRGYHKANRPEIIFEWYGFLQTCRAPSRPLQLLFCEFHLFEADARTQGIYFREQKAKSKKGNVEDSLLKLEDKSTAEVAIIDGNK